MTTVAVLGLGAMGSGLAGNLAAAGHPVTVWNRTRHGGAAGGLPLVQTTRDARPLELAIDMAVVHTERYRADAPHD